MKTIWKLAIAAGIGTIALLLNKPKPGTPERSRGGASGLKLGPGHIQDRLPPVSIVPDVEFVRVPGALESGKLGERDALLMAREWPLDRGHYGYFQEGDDIIAKGGFGQQAGGTPPYYMYVESTGTLPTGESVVDLATVQRRARGGPAAIREVDVEIVFENLIPALRTLFPDADAVRFMARRLTTEEEDELPNELHNPDPSGYWGLRLK